MSNYLIPQVGSRYACSYGETCCVATVTNKRTAYGSTQIEYDLADQSGAGFGTRARIVSLLDFVDGYPTLLDAEPVESDVSDLPDDDSDIFTDAAPTPEVQVGHAYSCQVGPSCCLAVVTDVPEFVFQDVTYEISFNGGAAIEDHDTYTNFREFFPNEVTLPDPAPAPVPDSVQISTDVWSKVLTLLTILDVQSESVPYFVTDRVTEIHEAIAHQVAEESE